MVDKQVRPGNGMPKPVLAVCGKGGVGKTAFSALLARILIAERLKPLLLVDADPVGGLTSAIGETAVSTLAAVRDQLVGQAMSGDKSALADAASQLDFYVMNALVEHPDFSLLAMGHNREKGCFCPANQLLKNAVDTLISSFAGVLIDAEAGIEQINRDVTGRVTGIIVVVDGSQRSMNTLEMIVRMRSSSHVRVVANRVPKNFTLSLAPSVVHLGSIPENEELRQFDRNGRSLWQLPADNEALTAVREIAWRLTW